jgi:glycosyltransferase involved in cell wall biosynthesis
MALAAAAREPESAPRLRIVGSGRREWRRDLERQARRLRVGDRVDILPAVPPDEVPALLGRAHLCAAPLAVTDRNVVQGCCPLKIVEYMMAGRPIVAPRLEPVREMLAHERTALLYKPDKPRRLADAILRLLDDPGLAGRLGANAAEDARQRFTWRRHNDAVAALYRELLASGDG